MKFSIYLNRCVYVMRTIKTLLNIVVRNTHFRTDLTINILRANSADAKIDVLFPYYSQMISPFFSKTIAFERHFQKNSYLFLEDRLCHFIQTVCYGETVSYEDNLYEMSKSIFLGTNKKNISKCCLLKILPIVLSVNHHENIPI